jgi:hypothetical protein
MESCTVRFNVDASIMTLSTATQFASFHTTNVERIAREERLGGMRVVEVLNRSPLMALIPSGDKPGTSPRRLKLWDSQTRRLVFEMAFESTVQNCAVNKSVLVAGIEGALHLFQLSTMSELTRLPARAATVFALSTTEMVSGPLLAYCEAAGGSDPAAAASAVGSVGSVRLFDCAQLRAVGSIQAHRSEVAQLSFSASGLLLASTSTTGSLVRVFSIPTGVCLHVLRHSLPQLLPIAAAAAAAAHEASTSTSAAAGAASAHRSDLPVPPAPRTSGGSSYSVPSSSSAVTSLCFCPEGRFLLSASAAAGSSSSSGSSGRSSSGFLNVFCLPIHEGEGRRQSDAKERTSEDTGAGDAASQGGEGEEEQDEEDEDGFCRVDGAEVLAAAAADSRAAQGGGSRGGRGRRSKGAGGAAQSGGAGGGDLQRQVDMSLRQWTAAAGSAGAEVQRHWLQIQNALFHPESGAEADAGTDAAAAAGARARAGIDCTLADCSTTTEAVGGVGSNSRSSSRGSGCAATTAGGQTFDFNYGGLVAAVRDLSLSSIAALSLGGAQEMGPATEAPALHVRLLLPTAASPSSSAPPSAVAADSDSSSAQSSSASPKRRSAGECGGGAGSSSGGGASGTGDGGSAFYCALTYGDGDGAASAGVVCADPTAGADGTPLPLDPPAHALSLVVVAARGGLYRRCVACSQNVRAYLPLCALLSSLFI